MSGDAPWVFAPAVSKVKPRLVNVLGIDAASHDPAAALVIDGQIRRTPEHAA